MGLFFHYEYEWGVVRELQLHVSNEHGHRGNLTNASLSFISQVCSLALALLLLDRK